MARHPAGPSAAILIAMAFLIAATPLTLAVPGTPQVELVGQVVRADRPLPPVPGAADRGLIPIPTFIRNRVYHTYYDMTTELQDMAAANTEVMKLTSLGRSLGGRELWNVEITNFATLAQGGESGGSVDTNGTPRWTVYIDGGHHGNEQLGMELALIMIHFLVDNYGSDAAVTRLVDTYHFYVQPMVNPDGNVKDNRENNNGIDLNRNYGFQWTDEGNHGSGPFSEPESNHNGEGMRLQDFDFYLSYHTGIDEILLPWAWTTALAPDDAMFMTVGAILTNLTGIPAVRTGSGLYIATGSSMDYAYGALGAPASTIEVDGQQFLHWSATEVQQRLAEEFEASVWFIEHIAELRSRLRVQEVTVLGRSGDLVRLGLTLANDGYGLPNRTAITLNETTPATLVKVDGNGTVPAKGAATLNLTVRPHRGGRIPLELNITYGELLINTTKNVTAFATVEVTVPAVPVGISGGVALIAAVAVAVVAILLLLLRRRQQKARRSMAAALPRPAP